MPIKSPDRLRTDARKLLLGYILVFEFTEEFTMGSINTITAGSVSNGYNIYNYNFAAAAEDTFSRKRFHDAPIRDAGMAAEVSKFIKSQILYHANTAVYAQTSALSPSILSFIQDVC